MTNPEDLYRDPTWLRYQYLEEGLTVPEMAEQAGASRAVVRKWMNRYGIETTGRGYTPDNTDYRDPDWLAFMYHEQGCTMDEIADHCDVVVSTIHRWMGKHDIESREKGTHTMDVNPMHNPEVVENHPMTFLSGEEHPQYKGESNRWRNREPWISIRRDVIRLDGHECQHCGMSRTEHYDKHGLDLHVHHITPTSEGGPKYDPLNLITLCHGCHNEEHAMYNTTHTPTDTNWVTEQTARYA